MSIEESLQRAVDRHDLWFMPMDKTDPVGRRMYLHEEVRAALFDGATEAQKTRMAALKADMESFVKGEAISMCFIPKRAKTATFGLLDPPGDTTWDLRSRTPSPSLRVIGMFATVNAFVGFDWWPRRVRLPWSDKEPLSDDDPLAWRLAIHECRERWHKILAGEVPVAGTDVRKYVTRNVIILG